MSYEFQPSNENRSKILDVCEKHGLRPVSPKDHGASTRRVQEVSGALPVYFKGGDPSDTGFASGNLSLLGRTVPDSKPMVDEVQKLGHESPDELLDTTPESIEGKIVGATEDGGDASGPAGRSPAQCPEDRPGAGK